MKSLAKKVLSAFACVLAWPIWLGYRVLSRLLGAERACMSISQGASHWPGLTGEYFRRAVLARVLARVGKDVVVSFGSIFSKPSAELGDGVYIGSYCMFGDVRIGDGSLIADHVCIPSGSAQHGIDRLDVPIRRQEGCFTTITIGCDCWIGSGAIVLADVGDHCVVGAGAVVTQAVEDYKVVAGNPAREVSDRRDARAADG